jgi:hypothetical protein
MERGRANGLRALCGVCIRVLMRSACICVHRIHCATAQLNAPVLLMCLLGAGELLTSESEEIM